MKGRHHSVMALQSNKKNSMEDGVKQKVLGSGVRVNWLLTWAKSVERQLEPGVTTADVCAKFVIPITSSRKCRYADLIEPENVGTPHYFLSHTWSLHFATLIEIVALRLRDEPNSFIWIDILAINQNRYKDKGELQSDDISYLASVVRKAKTTLFCLDENGKSLTRIWCLFEIWQTLKARRKLEILGYKMEFLSTQQLFRDMDVSKAQASLESDRVRILAAIAADIGHKQLADSIKAALVDSTQREAQEALAAAQQHAKCRTGGKPAEGPALAAATACTNAAQLASAAAQWPNAIKYQSRAVDLYRDVYGPEHISTTVSMHNLGFNLDRHGQCKEAADIMRQVVETRQRNSNDICSIKGSMEILASSLMRQSKYEEAEAVYRKVLALQAESPGGMEANEVGSTSIMNNLAEVLDCQGKLEEKVALERQKLELQSKVLGLEHEDTTWAMQSLAAALIKVEQHAEAEALQRQMIELRKKYCGPEDPHIIYSMELLQRNLDAQPSKQKEAKAMKRQIQELERKRVQKMDPEDRAAESLWSDMIQEMNKQGPKWKASSSSAFKALEAMGRASIIPDAKDASTSASKGKGAQPKPESNPKPVPTKNAPSATVAKPTIHSKPSSSVSGKKSISIIGQECASASASKN